MDIFQIKVDVFQKIVDIFQFDPDFFQIAQDAFQLNPDFFQMTLDIFHYKMDFFHFKPDIVQIKRKHLYFGAFIRFKHQNGILKINKTRIIHKILDFQVKQMRVSLFPNIAVP